MFSPFATPYTYPVYPTTTPRRHCHPAAPAYSRYPHPYLTGGYAMGDDDDDDVDEYEAYDTYRRQLEQAALLQRQRERRQQEEALLRRQLAIEREAERQRQLAAYKAALEAEEEERQRLRAEQAWRARQQEAVRQQRMRQLALEEEELRRRKLVEQQQQKKRIAQKQKQLEEDHASDPEEVDLNEAFDPLWQLLFGQTPRRAASKKPASKKPQPTPATIPVSDAAPSADPPPDSTPAPVPISNEGSPATEQDIETAVEAAQEEEEEEVEASSAESENAATVLQRHYRTHLHRRQALSTLSALSTSLDSQQASFTLPEQLTFQPSPPASLNSAEQDDENALPKPVTPKLAFSKTNAPFLAYEDFLVGLLSKIDAVSTGGDKTVKKARKELVKRVNDELEKLDAAREKAWAEQQKKEITEDETFQEEKSAKSAEVTTAAPQAQVEPTSEETSTQEDSTTSAETATEATLQPEAEQQAEEQDSSDAESDSTLTEDDREVDVDAVLLEAKKLGEKVERLEQAEHDFGVITL